jgi:hypothetical protein
MNSTTLESIFQECDFCKIKGTLGRNIFNKDGWYFCKPCLLEIEHEIKTRAEKNSQKNNALSISENKN